MVNYTMESKKDSKQSDNYTDDIKRDTSKDTTSCYFCIFVGENTERTKHRLCAKHIDEVAIVKGCGTCDSGKSSFKWYNQINPIKKWLLERTGFKFKNR